MCCDIAMEWIGQRGDTVMKTSPMIGQSAFACQVYVLLCVQKHHVQTHHRLYANTF